MPDDYRNSLEAIEQLNDRQLPGTQEGAIESTSDNEFWDKKEAGIYVDVVSGEVLFVSTRKFDSGWAWPGFTLPLDPRNLIENMGTSYGTVRTEVRSSNGDSHLGYVFDDGPAYEGDLRYCTTSPVLRFVSYEDLEAEGYGKYKNHFEGPGAA